MTQKNQHTDTSGPQNFEAPQLYTFPSITSEQNPADGRLKISSPEDVLAYIQCTLGFAAKNSLVVVAFAGRQLSTVVRCDLPQPIQQMVRSDTPECVTYMDFGLTESQELQLIDVGRYIGQLMASESTTTSCLVLYLCDDVTISNQQALSVTGVANSVIAAQFGLQRVPVEQSWLIHHSLLWHLRCASTTECSVQGSDVGSPEETDIFRSLDPEGLTSQEPLPASRKLLFPPAPLTLREHPADTQRLLNEQPQLVLDWLNLWDNNVDTGPQMLDSQQVAAFLESLEHARVREAIVALVCFDINTAIQGMAALEKFPTSVLAAADLAPNFLDGLTVRDCMEGTSDRAPDWQRVQQLERLCHQLLPLSDARSGGVVAGILVWIEWARGRGSIAMTYAKQARKHFPTEQFLITLEKFLSQGRVAGWATRKGSAWSPQHAA